jgi:hypothetical protein
MPFQHCYYYYYYYYSVADINQSLIDDALVDKEKIGGSNYFWSFPAKKDRIMQVQHQQNVEALDNMRASVEEASAKLADSKRGREGDDGERPTKLLRLSKNAQDRQALQQEVETLKENDPQALADLEKELKLATEGANRWTDNIFNCKSYLTKKRGMDKKGACKTLGITSAFDCKCIVVIVIAAVVVVVVDAVYEVSSFGNEASVSFCISPFTNRVAHRSLLFFISFHPDAEDKVPK